MDRDILYKQHQLIDPKHMTDCKCFDGFESNITHFHCGNCDEAENKIKTLTKTNEEQKLKINTYKSIIETINKDKDQYGDLKYEMSESRTSPSNQSSYLWSVSMTSMTNMAMTPSIPNKPSYDVTKDGGKTSSNSALQHLEDKSSD